MRLDDRTFAIGERAAELMKTYCESAAPRSYELWFNYVTGTRPQLNDAVKSRLADCGTLAERDIDELYETHLAVDIPAARAADAGAGMVMRIDNVVGMIDAALGSAMRYDQSLQTIAADLEGAPDASTLGDMLQCLMTATREVAETNQQLEAKLRQSRCEIDELRGTLDEVRLETLTDQLTGIANRKQFDTTLASAIEAAHITKGALALVVIDIDEFKRFNDRFGHITGDQVLRLVASAMRETVVGDATLARFGGEEFAIIMPGSDPSTAFNAAEEIRRNVERRELLRRSSGESLGRVTVSLGVAAFKPGDDPQSLLDRADHCMYRAKSAGRNRTVQHSDEPEAQLTDAA